MVGSDFIDGDDGNDTIRCLGGWYRRRSLVVLGNDLIDGGLGSDWVRYRWRRRFGHTSWVVMVLTR